MDVPSTLRAARLRAVLTQSDLARRARTSQAAVSSYEGGRKDPATATLARLLAATGHRLEASWTPARVLTADDEREVARKLSDVLSLADALPARHTPDLRYPPLRSVLAARA